MNVHLTKELGKTQSEIAEELNVSRSLVAMVQAGERSFPKDCNPRISGMSHKAALEIAEKETGGYISNILAYHPNVDFHPLALKMMVITEFKEVLEAIEGVVMSKMTPEEKRKAVVNALMEIEDAIDVANLAKGEIARKMGIDLKELNELRKDQVRRGERRI